MRTVDRFESKLSPEPNTGCWLWLGAHGPTRGGLGYGAFRFEGGTESAHRAAFALYVGPIPDGLQVLHRCDNKACVNPAHLYAGTRTDNARDMVERGQAARGDRNGSRKHPDRLARGAAHSQTMRAAAARGDRNGARTRPDRVARGERVASAKLTAAEVSAIRVLYMKGGTSQQRLADERGVSQTLIGKIVRGEYWRHVSGTPRTEHALR